MQRIGTYILRIGKLVALLLLVFTLSGGIVVASLFGVSLALVDEWSNQWNQGDLIRDDVNTIIYDAEKQVLAVLHAEKNRTPVAFEQIPPHVKQAFLAVEDIRFYEHGGVDLRAITRAVRANWQSGGYGEGASTITQQLVRLALLTPEKKMQRKVREMIIARELENRFSKDEIFNMYLNRVYFGHGAYGIQAAAQVYFGKSVEKLNLPEAALLAGLIKNPNGYSPYRHLETATDRRNIVLTQMWRYNLITDPDYRMAKEAPVALRGITGEVYRHPYVVDYVLDYVLKHYPLSEEQLYRGGLRIYTSIDPKIQRAIEETFQRSDNFPPSMPDQQIQGAMLVLDAKNGTIKGMMGGRGYQVKRGLNRAVKLNRQPGSALKPIVVYAPALITGYTPEYVFKDEPVNFQGYSPKNSDGAYRGNITMETALKYSVNTYAVKLLNQIGLDKGMDYAAKVGIPLTPKDRGLALGLGGTSYGVSPLELAAAYQPFANGGYYNQPNVVLAINDYRGISYRGQKLRREQMLSPAQATTMTQLLTKVVTSGTGTKAQISGVPVAGKTGTTQLPDLPEFKDHTGNKDAWFVGYTGHLIGAVWIGFDQTDAQHYLKGVYGGTYPAQVWQQAMIKCLDQKD